jgi:hypothetical protein
MQTLKRTTKGAMFNPTKKTQTPFLIISSIIISIIILSTQAFAAVDLRPEQLDFNGVLLGSEAQKTIKITTDTDSTLYAELTLSENLKEMIEIEPIKTLALKKDIPLDITIKAKGTKLGLTEGSIDIYLKSEGNSISSTSDNFIRVPVTISVSSQGIRAIEITGSAVSKAETGGVADLKISTENQGAVETELLIITTIDGISTQKFLAKTSALETKDFDYPLKTENTAPGNHELNIIIKDRDAAIYDRTLTLEVTEQNMIPARGDIIDILTPRQAIVGTQTETKTAFKNEGEKPMMVTIKTDISIDGSVIKHGEETIFTPAGKTAISTTGFTPDKAGTYTVKAQAYFNGVVTDVTERNFDTINPDEAVALSGNLWLAAVLVAVILFIFSYKKRFHDSKKGAQHLEESMTPETITQYVPPTQLKKRRK